MSSGSQKSKDGSNKNCFLTPTLGKTQNEMRTLIAIALFVASIVGVSAQVHVNGYYRENGTYVQPHWRSSPSNTASDNWSTRGNVNPHTGQIGMRSDDGIRHYRYTGYGYGR